MKRLLLTAALALGAVAYAQSSSTSGSTTDTNPVTGASGQAGSTTTSDKAGQTTPPVEDPGTLGTGGAGAEGGAMDAEASGQSEAAAKKEEAKSATKADKAAAKSEGTGGAGAEHGAMKGDAKADPLLGVMLPEDPKEFLNMVNHANTMELELANLAKEKAVGKDVKKHAEMMIKDHTAMKQRLDQLAQKMGHTFAEPKPLDDKHQKVMDAHKADMEKLRVLEGLMFDRAYLAHMIGEHDHDIAKFTAAMDKYDDANLDKALAKELPTLNKHRDHTAGLIKNAPSVQAKAAHSKANK